MIGALIMARAGLDLVLVDEPELHLHPAWHRAKMGTDHVFNRLAKGTTRKTWSVPEVSPQNRLPPNCLSGQ